MGMHHGLHLAQSTLLTSPLLLMIASLQVGGYTEVESALLLHCPLHNLCQASTSQPDV